MDRRTVVEVIVDNEKLEADQEFCYLGDMISARDGCELAVIIAANVLRQVLPTAPHSHQLQSVASDQKLGVLNMHKESDATCSIYLTMTVVTLNYLQHIESVMICYNDPLDL